MLKLVSTAALLPAVFSLDAHYAETTQALNIDADGSLFDATASALQIEPKAKAKAADDGDAPEVDAGDFLDEHKHPDYDSALQALWYNCEGHQVFGAIWKSWMYADWKTLMAGQAIESAEEFITNEEVLAREQKLRQYIVDWNDLKELFIAMDEDNSGFLTAKEVLEAIDKNTGGIKEKMAHFEKDAADENFLAFLDSNGDDHIAPGEFIAGVMYQGVMTPVQMELRSLWNRLIQKFDMDLSGTLSTSEILVAIMTNAGIRHALERFHPFLDDKMKWDDDKNECKKHEVMLRYADVNNAGVPFTQEDLMKMIKSAEAEKPAEEPEKEEEAEKPKKPEQQAETVQQEEAALQASFVQKAAADEAAGGASCDKAMPFLVYLKNLDPNFNGDVSEEEFIAASEWRITDAQKLLLEQAFLALFPENSERGMVKGSGIKVRDFCKDDTDGKKAAHNEACKLNKVELQAAIRFNNGGLKGILARFGKNVDDEQFWAQMDKDWVVDAHGKGHWEQGDGVLTKAEFLRGVSNLYNPRVNDENALNLIWEDLQEFKFQGELETNKDAKKEVFKDPKEDPRMLTFDDIERALKAPVHGAFKEMADKFNLNMEDKKLWQGLWIKAHETLLLPVDKREKGLKEKQDKDGNPTGKPVDIFAVAEKGDGVPVEWVSEDDDTADKKDTPKKGANGRSFDYLMTKGNEDNGDEEFPQKEGGMVEGGPMTRAMFGSIMKQWQIQSMDTKVLNDAWSRLVGQRETANGQPGTGPWVAAEKTKDVGVTLKHVMDQIRNHVLDSAMDEVGRIAEKWDKNVHAPNFFNLLDQDADGMVSKEEFVQGILRPVLSIKELDATPDMLRKLFAELDSSSDDKGGDSGESQPDAKLDETELMENIKKNRGNILGVLVNAGLSTDQLKDLFHILDEDGDSMIDEGEFIRGIIKLNDENKERKRAEILAAKAIVNKYAFHCEVGSGQPTANECYEVSMLTLDECMDAWTMWKEMALMRTSNSCTPMCMIIIGSVLAITLLGAVVFFVLSSEDEGAPAA